MLSFHTHSNYSILRGTIRIPELIEHAKKWGSPYVSLTDTNGMYGLIQFARQVEEAGIKPILGVYLDDQQRPDLHVVFLAKNNAGYAQICKMITTRKLQEDFKLIDLFKQKLDNVFIITSSIALLREIKLTTELRKNLYVELIVTAKKKKQTRELYEHAKETGLQIVASHPAYFAKPDDFLLHQVVRAIDKNSTLEQLAPDEIVDEEYYLKSPKEMKYTWRGLPEALWNMEYIAQNCNVNLQLGKYKFPVFPMPLGETPFSYLWKICFEALGRKFQPITDKAVKRLQYELEVIDELGFCDYFLVVWDIVREAHSRSMMTIGRGSAANSLVSYCLGFTQVDPLEHNLYFERFLNRGRTSPPDVDLDFSWKERDAIVKYVYEKYGYDKVAMISTTVTFRARSAFRETAKVFGFSDREISKFSKFIPWTSAQNLPDLAEKFPEAKSLKFDEEPWKTVINIASQLAGFPRHHSIHPGGIVITEKPITNYVALEYAKNKGIGLVITQPDMYPIEDFGLIKIDLLSQRSLGVLKDTMVRIAEDVKINGSKTINKRENQPKIFKL
ncbi:MAG: PHP domain-containing protein [Bacteroidetes bacterium]|nr:PHP domain-containing protein [Bacteroidota bacterium]